tara:strand:+ start:997 stop:2163 length:1167 start_codon:yes stop_codon:yes gene_type:complete
MSEFEVLIDFGSKNLRLGVFDNKSECIYSSKINIEKNSEIRSSENSLKDLVRDAEKQLTTHLDNVSILYDSSKFYSVDLSIKKIFDQPTFVAEHYNNLIDEANFIISENNFKDQVIHIIINNIIIDNNKKLEAIANNVKTKSLILDLKFICLNKSLIYEISSMFKKNNLNISNIYCTSYVKTIFYKKVLQIKNNFIFLDIGYERTSALIFKNNKFEFFNSINIGGNNITKDISKILNLNIEFSENLKRKYNKNENEISFDKKDLNDINLYSEISKKKISLGLLKQVIEARIDEIIELSINKNNYFKNIDTSDKPCIIFIGDGSKLISNNYNLKTKNNFSEFIYFDENESKICKAGFSYKHTDESQLTLEKKRSKKVGFFEGFFNFFSK